jgi:serine/threonine protein kinase
VMEYAQGTLNPPTPTRQGFRDQLKKTGWVFYQLLKGLEYLHQQHIVHMDVANRNVVFVDGVPKWTDFGLARVDTEAGWLDVRRLGHTMHGHVQALGKVGRVPKRLRRLIRRLRRAGPNNRASHYLQDDVWKSLLTPVAKLTRTQVMLGGSLASNTTESIVY